MQCSALQFSVVKIMLSRSFLRKYNFLKNVDQLNFIFFCYSKTRRGSHVDEKKLHRLPSQNSPGYTRSFKYMESQNLGEIKHLDIMLKIAIHASLKFPQKSHKPVKGIGAWVRSKNHKRGCEHLIQKNHMCVIPIGIPEMICCFLTCTNVKSSFKLFSICLFY